MIIASGGRLIFDLDEIPPFPPQGFTRTDNPRIFEPILGDCKLREKKFHLDPNCGCRGFRNFCGKFNKFVSIGECLKCLEK